MCMCHILCVYKLLVFQYNDEIHVRFLKMTRSFKIKRAMTLITYVHIITGSP